MFDEIETAAALFSGADSLSADCILIPSVFSQK